MTAPVVLNSRAGTFGAASGPRVLIASVSAGSGHVRAAEAILDAMRSVAPLSRAVHVNVLDHARPGFRRLYEDGYSFLADRAPGAWSTMYRWTDREGAAEDPILGRVQQRQVSGFLEYVRRFRPDRIVATHFLVPQLLEALPADVRPALDMVITDFDVHRIWIHPRVERYFVAGETARQRLMAAGISTDRVIATGIPIHPLFLRPVDRDGIRAALGFSSKLPVILALPGGRGAQALDRTIAALFGSPFRLGLISVAGRSDALREAVDRLKPPDHVTLQSQGFAGNMHELMSAADIIVSKPGGLTVSEGLAKGAAMILHSAIPGQEERNATYVAMRGAGLHVARGGSIANAVFSCLEEPSRLVELRERAAACARPGAAFEVARSLSSVPTR